MGRPRSFNLDTAVEQAMETFWTNGFSGTSPANLADALGIGKGSLYNTFGSKRRLFDKALDRYDQAGVELLAEMLGRPGTVKERIRAFMTFLVDSDLDAPQRRGCLAVNTAIELAGRDDKATRAVRRMQWHTESALTGALEAARRNGEISEEIDPRALAEFLMNTISGLRVMTKTAEDPRALYRIIDTALATF